MSNVLLFEKPPVPSKSEQSPPALMMAATNACDMYNADDSKYSSTPSGLVRVAPKQVNPWCHSPVYRNSSPTLVDAHTGTAYARTGERLAADMPEGLLAHIKNLDLPEELRWLHCARILGLSPQTPGQAALVIYDLMMPNTPLEDRLEYMHKILAPELGFRCRPIAGRIYLAPTFSDDVSADLWAALHLTNQQFIEPFFSGILSRELSSTYKFQSDDFKKTSLAWHFHPFIHAF
jgi:hypothetical protein